MTGAVLCLLFLVAPACFVLRVAENRLERACVAYLLLTLELAVAALGAAALGQLGNEALWLGVAASSALVAGLVWRPRFAISAFPGCIRLNPPWLALSLIVLLTTAGGLSRAPGNWDGVVYHLPRALYYLQFGSFAAFPSITAAQLTHPLLGTIWLVAAMILGSSREHLFFLPHLLAWLTLPAACLLFADGISSRGASPSRRPWLVATFALLPLTALLGAGTEKNDLLVAAYTAIAVALCVCRIRGASFWSLLAMGCAVAVKASALPAVLPWAFFFWRYRARRSDPRFAWPLGALSAVLLVGACGYGRNLVEYRSPLGPRELIPQLGFQSPGQRVKEGGANLFRYLIDAGTPDGFPGVPLADAAVRGWREGGISAFRLFTGVNLTEGRLSGGFPGGRDGLAHEDPVFLGFAYFWCCVAALVFFVARRPRDPALRSCWASWSFIFLFHCFAAAYDQWHGRFFLVGLIFLAPALAIAWEEMLVDKPRPVALALLCLLFAQSVYCCIFRSNASLFQSPGRLAEVLRDRSDLVPIFTAIDSRVPFDAVLATRLPPLQAEYPLFGPQLKRVVVSTMDIRHGKLPIPANARWLFFRADVEAPRRGDQALGEDFYLRRL